MSRLTIISLAMLLLLGFVNIDLASAKPSRQAKPIDAVKVAARTIKQMEKSSEAAIAVIERIETLGAARIDGFYANGKDELAQKFESQIVKMITRTSEITIQRMEMFKDRTVEYLENSGEYELAAELEYQFELLVEIIVLETEQSIAAVTGDVISDPDPETAPDIIDAE